MHMTKNWYKYYFSLLRFINSSICGDDFINSCSFVKLLPYLDDIEGYDKIIEIDFDYYRIYYNFEISEDTQNAINNFNQYFNELDESLNFEVKFCDLP